MKRDLKDCDIYIVDSYGESKSFYKISNVVFLGGSLVSKGGQNPLEALKFGCNILHGNYTFNFKDIYKMLEKEKLSLKVNNSKDLEKKALILLNDKKNNLNKIKKLKNIGDLILRINPNAKAIIHGDDIDTCTIEWIDGTNPIAIQDIKNIVSNEMLGSKPSSKR